MIIFDLDDTLIDTSGAVTPFKLKECLKRLIAGGVPISDLSEAHRQLLELNAKSPKSLDALVSFAAPYNLSSDQIKEAAQELMTPLPPDFVIPTTPYAKEILHFYQARCPIALVTGGYPPFQREKLKKAGIDTSVFSMIAIPEDSKKGPYYEAFQKKFSVDPSAIWVCGDRVAMDLAPAHALGFRTIHMRWGRGMRAAKEPWIDKAISDLRELKETIK